MIPTINLTLDDRYIPKKSNRLPVVLLITHNRVPKRFPTKYKLAPDEFQKIQGNDRVSSEMYEYRNLFRTLVSGAQDAAEQLGEFSLESFSNQYILGNEHFKEVRYIEVGKGTREDEFEYNKFYKKFPILLIKESTLETVEGLYKHKIEKLLKKGKIGTASVYYDTYSVFMKFRGDQKIRDVDDEFLHDYEAYMVNERNCTLGTVGIKMRVIRLLWKIAIKKKVVNSVFYPFGEDLYDIPTGQNIKRALSNEQLSKLWTFNTRCEKEFIAKCYWFFLFLGNGMNPKDCALLKFKNMENSVIRFTRAKTKDTTRHAPPNIFVYVNPDMRRFIEILGNKDRNPENYIFPILRNGMDAMEQYQAIVGFTRFIRWWMSKIAEELKFLFPVGPREARHSLATVLKASGVSTKIIQEMLGHTVETTTNRYLREFDISVYQQCSHLLTSFKNPGTAEAIVKEQHSQHIQPLLPTTINVCEV